MKPRIILFFVGVCILILGALPLIANIIPAASAWIEDMPPAGSITYQFLLVLLGVIAVSYSIKGKRTVRKEE